MNTYNTTSTSAVAKRYGKSPDRSLYAQVTQLAMNPIMTINTPNRCGKSLRT